MSDTIAVLVSDIHLSEFPPIARSVEQNWFEVMERTLSQLRGISNHHQAPIICSGDVFDKWNSTPSIINFAISSMPKCYSVCGNHDLPNHDYNSRKRSAYWTLVEAGIIDNIEPKQKIKVHPRLAIYGFPCGTDVLPKEIPTAKGVVDLAVIHSYIWMKGKSFPNAPPESRLKVWLKKLKGYTTATFGDNHQQFGRGIAGVGTFVYNCGCLIRRKIDEKEYFPQVGLLQSNGTVIPQSLDCSADRFIDVSGIEKAAESALDASDFIQEMAGLARTIVDFGDAMKEFCQRNNISSRVQKMIQEAMEK